MPLVSRQPKKRIILGLMTFGPEEKDGARLTKQQDLKKALDVFQERGYHEVDTARIYVGGQQEAFTRSVGWKERGLTLATKVHYPQNPGENSAKLVRKSVETSLKELGTDCVDILYLHRADRATPFQETLEAINELHGEGKFVRFGISNFAAFEVAEVVMTCKYNGWIRPTIYQGIYNVLLRDIEPELLPACRRYGLDVVVYNPLAGGLFSGKIKSKDIAPHQGRFSNTSERLGNMYRFRYFRESTFRALQIVETAVEEHGLSMIEAALRWMVHHSKLHIKDGKDGVLLGMSSIEQLQCNLDSLDKGPLPKDVVNALDEAWALAKVDTPTYWHGELAYSYDTYQALFARGTK
ncbi:hypothetical protein CDD81_6409 [Ophiocordyceps australis]|uniref:NADP-dependent oxidoreductase domain-containing protein n=1 Tax=Ophiocordyceps australis TaxID=1399860 RepID=A0A2C5Y7P9_9HYPO|nr:hypothetical protein CDD81_6409 [Ophiocordyceps australis]